MRKQFKLLLLVAVVLALFVMTMIVSSASEEAPYVAMNGETVVSEHTSFDAAYAVVKAGSANTIRLDADVTLNEALNFDVNVTLDGAGHTMTFGSTVRNGFLFNFRTEAMTATIKNLTVFESMLKPSSARVSGLVFAHEDSLTITLKNVIAENHTGDIFNGTKIAGVKNVSGHTLTIEDCVLTSDHGSQSIMMSSNEVADANGDKITKRNTVIIKNSTLEGKQAANTGFFYVINAEIRVEDSTFKTTGLLFKDDASTYPDNITVVGNTYVEADTFAYTRGNGHTFHIGTLDDGPQPEIHVGTYLERWDKNLPGYWNIYGGTFYSENYFFRNGAKAAHVINVYGGTFIADSGKPIFRNEASTAAPVITITGGEFHLSEGSQMVSKKAEADPHGITVPSKENAVSGAIKVYLGKEASTNADIQSFFIENGWIDAGAHFYITAWDVDTSNMYEFTQNFTGTFAEWKTLVGAVVYQAPITAYEALRHSQDANAQIFYSADDTAAGKTQNLFIDIGVMPPFIIKNPDVTVTITGGSYDVNGQFAVIEGGNLVFTNCEINATTTLVSLTGGKVTIDNVKITATGTEPLIVIEGAGAAVELKGADTLISAENAIVNIKDVDCGTVTVNGGTYISDSGKFLFNSTVTGLVDKINIIKATFKLANGSVLGGGRATNEAFLLTAAAAGDITFYLDAGSADSTVLQEFLSADKWFAAKAYYRVIGWGAGAASLYEMTENFSGTLAEYKAMLRDYILTAPQKNYEALRSETSAQVFFASGANQNLFVEYATIPEMLPFVIKDANVTVTLTDWNYTANGLFARVEAGTLILNNCTMDISMNTGSFIIVSGTGVVEISGGVYTGNAPTFFEVTTGELTFKGGYFVNTAGNIVDINGAGAVMFDPATANTVLRFYAGGSIVNAKEAAGATITINGGEFKANFVENEGQAPAGVSMFTIGGSGATLMIHGGSFDNQEGDYIFNLSAAGADVVIDGGTFNGGLGWVLAGSESKFTVNANADPAKNPVFSDTNKTAKNAYFFIDGKATVELYVGTYTAGVAAQNMFFVNDGALSVCGGTYTGSMFSATADSKIMITGGSFTAKGNGAILFDFEGALTLSNFQILLDQGEPENNPTFTVMDNAYIFDTALDAETMSTVLTNANITVSGYAKVGLTLVGVVDPDDETKTLPVDLTFATEADAKELLEKYVANGTLTITDTIPTFKINGKVNITVAGGTWNYGSDYLFNLVDGGATVTISGGKFDTVGGGVLYLAGEPSTVVIGNTADARQAPKFNVTNGLGIVNNTVAGTTITIHNGTFTATDILDCNLFTLAAATEVVVNGGTFTINKGTAVDKNGKVENNSVIFNVTSEGTNITINNGTFKAARIVYLGFEFSTEENVTVNNSTLTINGGSFSSNAFAQHNSYMFQAATGHTVMNILGGSYKGNLYTTAIIYVNAPSGAVLNVKGGSFEKGLAWVYVSGEGENTVTFDKLAGGTGPVFEGLNDGVGADMKDGTAANTTPVGIWFEKGTSVGNFNAGTFKLSAADQCALFTLSAGTFTFGDGVVAQASYRMFRVSYAFEGTITINGGTYTGIYVADMFYFSADAQTKEPILNGKYIINGGTFNAKDSATLFHIAALDDKLELVINGGTFTSETVRLAFFTAATAMKVVIEGGTFSTTAPRMFFLEENAEPLVIKGGEFILADKSGNTADDGIIYLVSKKHAKVSIQGGTFVDERQGNNQTFIKMNPYGVVDFAGAFKIYSAEKKTNFYYDGNDNAKSVPLVDMKETYNDKEYYVCVAYYNENAPVVQNAPVIRPVMGAEGLTFSASVSADVATHLATLGTVSYGTLIFPTKYLTSGWSEDVDFLAELKAYAIESGKSESSVYAMVDAVNGLVTAEDGSVTFCASLINVKEANYTLDITGIAYAKVTASDGTVTYYYASHLSAGTTSNMRTAAKKALFDLNSTALDDGLNVYCYASIMKSNSFSRYSTPFQNSLKKYLAEADRVPQW